jgi:hypothetical protein
VSTVDNLAVTAQAGVHLEEVMKKPLYPATPLPGPCGKSRKKRNVTSVRDRASSRVT